MNMNNNGIVEEINNNGIVEEFGLIISRSNRVDWQAEI